MDGEGDGEGEGDDETYGEGDGDGVGEGDGEGGTAGVGGSPSSSRIQQSSIFRSGSSCTSLPLSLNKTTRKYSSPSISSSWKVRILKVAPLLP